MTVLILDDEILAIGFMMDGVHWDACGVDKLLTAHNAEEARQVVSSNRVDIILCDIEMPGDNGIEFMQWARDNGHDMACIFLTCHAKFEYAQEALRLQCRDYILKPAPFSVIEEKVRLAVEDLKQKKRDEETRSIGKQWIANQREELSAAYGAAKTRTDVVVDAENYIYQHLGDFDLSVQRVADVLGFSGDYLGKLFKQERGITLNKFIVQTRMERAAALLREGNISISLVAEMVGYENYSYFSTSFKKLYGCNPTQYGA